MTNSRSLTATAVLTIALICVGSSGCADTSWRGYGHDTTQFSRQPHESTLNASTVATLDFHPPHAWDFTLPGGGSFTAPPSAHAHTLLLGSLNSPFYPTC